jgi:hypothetical protein
VTSMHKRKVILVMFHVTKNLADFDTLGIGRLHKTFVPLGHFVTLQNTELGRKVIRLLKSKHLY